MGGRNYGKKHIKFGYYFYVTARNAEEARRQAERFADLIRNKDYSCRPAMDFEEFSGLSLLIGLGTEKIGGFFHKRAQIESMGVQLALSGFQTGELQNVID